MPWSLSKHWNAFCDRSFHLSAVHMQKELSKKEASFNEGFNKVPVQKFDRYLLVWSGKFKSRDEVPKYVERSTLLKCHSVCRVKVCNYMMALTLISAFLYILSGKRDAKKGMSISEMNRQWHREYNKNFDEEQKA